MKSEQVSQWTDIRKKGQWYFVWRTGLLQWGLIMFGIFVGMQAAQNPERLLSIIAINLLIWSCGGLLVGFCVWHANEWQFKRHLDEQSNH